MHRPKVDLPARDVAELNARLNAKGGPTAAVLFYWAVVSAAQAAAAGHGRLLPRGERAARGSIGEKAAVRWPQGRAEYEWCKAQIEGAGSSVTAVLREFVRRYLESGGVQGLAWVGLPCQVSLENAPTR